MVVWFFRAVSWVCLRFVIVVFPDDTHLLFLYYRLISVVDVDIAIMIPNQPLPFHILSYANIIVQNFN